MRYKINWDFISRLEGGRKLRGYVPNAATSRSGVTIATGFDLGQRNLRDLEKLKLADALIKKLAPYLGRIQRDAERYLKDHPLSVTPEQAASIDKAAKRKVVEDLARIYDASASKAFASLTAAAQTVIASVSFQYGYLPSRTPTFWKLVTSQDWSGTIKELRDFGDAYKTRRDQEADLLQSSISGRSTTTQGTTKTVRKGDRGDLIRELQKLLNQANLTPLARLVVDGHFGAMTERQVCVFQKRRGLAVDGVVGPATWKALRSVNSKGRQSAKKKSGKDWVTWANTHAQNSSRLADLDGTFRKNVEAFKKALEDGGATVTVRSTKRSDKRAYLFHWSWKISLGKCRPTDASELAGVNIEWDHGDATRSREGAREMVTGFGLAVPPKSDVAPSLTSNHIFGKAVDMNITWSGKKRFKKKDGTEVEVSYMSDVNANTRLHQIGQSYGVRKLLSDAPHWSHNGR